MSACKTTRDPVADDGRQPTAQTRTDSRETSPGHVGGEPPAIQQGGVDSTQRNQLVTAMFNQAASLAKEGKFSAAVPVYREIEQTYGDGPGDDKSLGAWAIFYQGDLQRQLRNYKAAVAAYERLDQRFAHEPSVRAVVADALHKKGETLIEQGDTRAAIAAFDEIDRRYAEDRDAGFRQRAARALFAKGSLLEKQGAGEAPAASEFPSANISPSGDTAAAVAVFDDIVRRFGRDKDPSIRNIIGGTLLKKSEALRLSGDDQATITVYGEIVERFGNDDAQVSRVLVATALFRKGLTLGRQDRTAGIETFEEVIRRFATDTNPNVRKIVGQANTAKQRLASEASPMHDAGQDTRTPPQKNAPMYDN
ncbi:MAG: tetratricopeptide repeat protein [Azoarcus sp.]|jgi:tetratricopeptide (TPR) repeat protein|nr:tetratricopeptide repeat protein [Azoarcus sp.]